jgi:hypothetical protein
MKRKRLLFCVSLAALAGLGASWGVLAGGRLPFLARPVPQCCWLAFGPQANVRVLVRLDGEAVTLEQYVGDRPTGRMEQFQDRYECKGVTIEDPDGRTSYVLTGMSGTAAKGDEPARLLVRVSVKGPVEYREYCDIVPVSPDPARAGLAQFHGPLTVQAQTVNWEVPADLALRRGDRATDLRAVVGTMDACKGCWVVVCSHESAGGKTTPAFPPGVHPFVDVEFPAQRPGDPPLHCRYPLDQFC